MSRDELLTAQRERWGRMTENWARSSKGSRCVCLGDLNLHYLRWNRPEQSLKSMVNRTKQMIENRGSIQLIESHTRSWNHQIDSCLDHIWLNCQDRLVNFKNKVRSV